MIHVNTHGFARSTYLKHYANTKLRLALSLYMDRISRIDIALVDVNGPKGGKDMRCKIKLKPLGMPTIVINETSEDIFEAICNSTHRIKRTVKKQFDRALEQQHVLH